MSGGGVGAGYCLPCARWCPETVVVALVHVNSGPGRTVAACLPHAREYAAYPLAPQWLRDDLAEVDRHHSAAPRTPAAWWAAGGGAAELAGQGCRGGGEEDQRVEDLEHDDQPR